MESALEYVFEKIVSLLYLLVRLSLWIIVELVYDRLAWWYGWCVCRLVTFNSLPVAKINERKITAVAYFLVCTIGLLALIGSGALLAYCVG